MSKVKLQWPCWCGKVFSAEEVIKHSGKQLQCSCGMVHDIPEIPEELKKKQ